MCFFKGALSQEVTAFLRQNSANIVTKYVYSYTKINFMRILGDFSKRNYIV